MQRPWLALPALVLCLIFPGAMGEARVKAPALVVEQAEPVDPLQPDNLVWIATITEFEPFVLEFLRSYDHQPALIRGIDSPVRRFFADARLTVGEGWPVPGRSEVLLREGVYREDRDSLPREMSFLLSESEQRAGEPQTVTLLIRNAQGETGLDPNPASLTYEVEAALIQALDKRFKRLPWSE